MAFEHAGISLLMAATVAALPLETGCPPPQAKAPIVEPAHAKAALAALISSEDYPMSALHEGRGGTTQVKLAIGPNGRVTKCDVLRTSGSAALDSATCRLLQSRARFIPARDAAGATVADEVVHSQSWQLPGR